MLRLPIGPATKSAASRRVDCVPAPPENICFQSNSASDIIPSASVPPLSQREKLLDAILRNPQDVRLDDACKAAKWIGFTKESGSGSHHVFSRPGEETQLNFQRKKDGKIPPYQGRQLGVMINKYRDADDEN